MRLAPSQQFHWIDEGILPEREYCYTVVPFVGTAQQPVQCDRCAPSLRTAAVTDAGVPSSVSCAVFLRCARKHRTHNDG